MGVSVKLLSTGFRELGGLGSETIGSKKTKTQTKKFLRCIIQSSTS